MKIINMPKFITFLTIIICLASFITSMITNKVFSATSIEYTEITVCEGDTLWSIAMELNGNIKENIYNIKKVNGLTSSMIYPGQELKIPKQS